MSKFTKTIAGFAGAVALVASLAGSAGAASFSTNLTVGSTGADVSALQAWLVSKGFLVMPTGVSYGYFGSLTKKAVAAYQAAKGITPAVGYFGPITRAAVNAEAGSTTGGTSSVPGCMPGALYSSTTGAPCTSGSTSGGTSGSTGITTVGVEGTIAVTQSSAGINSTVYEGDTMAPILGVQVEAKNSDVAVQRIKLDLGTTTKIYNKIYRRIYVTDGSTVLASSDLNSSTVIKDGSRYYITLSGFNFLVKAGQKRVLTIKADVMGSIDSLDRNAGDATLAWGIRLASNGIRAIDGAGIDQYGGDTTVGKSITVSAELAETATLNVSTNSATPVANDVVASAGSAENELDRLAVLAVDLRADKDDVKLKDFALDLDKVGAGGATASTTVYLYDGSTEVDNASYDSTGANGGFVKFTDVDLVIPKNTTKTLLVKVDVRNANGTASQLTVNATSSGITAENTKGDTVSVSGSATGETQYLRNVGPVFTLVSKTISKSSTAASNNTSTSTAQATFTLKIKAVGGDILFGSVASTVPMVGSSSPYIVTYYNGAATVLNVASSTAFDVPSSGVTTSGLDNSFLLQENNEVTIPVTFTFEGRNAAGVAISTGAYSVALERINWKYAGAQTSSFMSGKTDWRTSTVQLP
jgi:hypothetical protein